MAFGQVKPFHHSAMKGDPWLLERPIPLMVVGDNKGHVEEKKPKESFSMEKNWMPFVHKVGQGGG